MPSPNTNINFKETDIDIAPKYVGVDDYYTIYSYLNDTGKAALFSNGPLYSWGLNSSGQLGTSNLTHRSSPVQVGALTTWNQLAAGKSHSLAIKEDGTLWAWGSNGFGQTGLASATSSPVQVGTFTDWKQVSAGGAQGDTSLGVSHAGWLYVWGSNTNGQTTQNSVSNPIRTTPLRIGSLDDWDKVAAGTSHCLAIKKNGSLWGWGSSFYGQVGDGSYLVSGISSPVQVGALTDWKQISAGQTHSLGIRNNGSLWGWGRDDIGEQGAGNIGNDKTVPVQIGTLTTWSQCSAGVSFSMFVSNDGTLWATGLNTNGQLGLGDRTHRSSPVQVGSLTNWSQVYAGLAYTVALKTDGTLWAWGLNTNGQLGLGDRTHRSSPVQVGSLTTWNQLAVGGTHVLTTLS